MTSRIAKKIVKKNIHRWIIDVTQSNGRRRFVIRSRVLWTKYCNRKELLKVARTRYRYLWTEIEPYPPYKKPDSPNNGRMTELGKLYLDS